MNNHPIVIVEQDQDEAGFLAEAFTEAGSLNECRCFDSTISALEYLKMTADFPSLIISEISMPFVDGLEFKHMINDDQLLSGKNIPFVFLSGPMDAEKVNKAGSLSIQCFFQKPDNITDLDIIAKAILTYTLKGRMKNFTAFC